MKHLRTLASQAKNNVRLALIRRSMSANRYETRDAITLFSDPRGGSTWLMEMLCHQLHTAPIFEPLHLTRGLIDKTLNFDWRQYIPKDEQWDEALKNFDEIFRAQRLNEWVVSRGKIKQYQNSRQLIFKFVRGTSLLPWLLNNFHFSSKPLLLLRHPIAVVNSQIERFGASDSFEKRQPNRYANYRQQHETFLETLETPAERHIATWCLHNSPILNDSTALKQVTLIHYEHLVRDPEPQLAKVFGSFGMPTPETVLNQIRKPSQSSALNRFEVNPDAQIEKWTTSINRDEKTRIQRVLDEFGISIYNVDDPYPQSSISTTIT